MCRPFTRCGDAFNDDRNSGDHNWGNADHRRQRETPTAISAPRPSVADHRQAVWRAVDVGLGRTHFRPELAGDAHMRDAGQTEDLIESAPLLNRAGRRPAIRDPRLTTAPISQLDRELCGRCDWIRGFARSCSPIHALNGSRARSGPSAGVLRRRQQRPDREPSAARASGRPQSVGEALIRHPEAMSVAVLEEHPAAQTGASTPKGARDGSAADAHPACAMSRPHPRSTQSRSSLARERFCLFVRQGGERSHWQ